MKHVYLVGFMGSGKSTVGRLVAERLGLECVDLDVRIEQYDGRRIGEIFRESGEPGFRNIESAVLRRVAAAARQVVALGGGTYCSAANRDIVDRTGIAVYLETALDTILDRVRLDGARPLFTSRDQVATLLATRLPSYEKAPVRIRTDGLEPVRIADLVISRIEPVERPS